MKDVIRTVRFSPYRKGMGPTFTLKVWDTNRIDTYGKSVLGFELTQSENNKKKVIFTGEEFACSPCHPIDSDDMVKSLMGFLTLRPGDTDREYFDGYNEDQLNFANQHGEILRMEVISRFGEE